MPELDAGRVRRILSESLDVWARSSKLTFQEVHPKDDANIQVSFVRLHHGDGYDFDGPGNVLAHAFYPGGGRGGNTHFDADETWLLYNEDRHDGNFVIFISYMNI